MHNRPPAAQAGGWETSAFYTAPQHAELCRNHYSPVECQALIIELLSGANSQYSDQDALPFILTHIEQMAFTETHNADSDWWMSAIKAITRNRQPERGLFLFKHIEKHLMLHSYSAMIAWVQKSLNVLMTLSMGDLLNPFDYYFGNTGGSGKSYTPQSMTAYVMQRHVTNEMTVLAIGLYLLESGVAMPTLVAVDCLSYAIKDNQLSVQDIIANKVFAPYRHAVLNAIC